MVRNEENKRTITRHRVRPAEKTADLARPPMPNPKPKAVNSKPFKAEPPPRNRNANRPETKELKHVRKRGRRRELEALIAEASVPLVGSRFGLAQAEA